MDKEKIKLYSLLIVLMMAIMVFLPFSDRFIGSLVVEKKSFNREVYTKMEKTSGDLQGLAALGEAFGELNVLYSYQAVNISDYLTKKGVKYPFGR